jgi:hypothetical protein
MRLSMKSPAMAARPRCLVLRMVPCRLPSRRCTRPWRGTTGRCGNRCGGALANGAGAAAAGLGQGVVLGDVEAAQGADVVAAVIGPSSSPTVMRRLRRLAWRLSKAFEAQGRHDKPRPVADLQQWLHEPSTASAVIGVRHGQHGCASRGYLARSEGCDRQPNVSKGQSLRHVARRHRCSSAFESNQVPRAGGEKT